MPDARPPIPESVKRDVRQRCGFGCIICGLPIVEYDHLEEWATVKEHTVANIVLLCPRHHAEKTKGLLTREQVEANAARPFNIKNGKTAPYELHFDGTQPKIEAEFGGNVVWMPIRDGNAEIIPIAVDGVALITLRVRQGRMSLSTLIYSEDGTCILRIVDNVLELSADSWDITFIGQTLTLRSDPHRSGLRLRFAPPNRVELLSGRFMLNGIELLLSKSGLVFPGGFSGSNSCFVGCNMYGPVGLLLGTNPQNWSGFMWLEEVPRQYHHQLGSEDDAVGKWYLDAWGT